MAVAVQPAQPQRRPHLRAAAIGASVSRRRLRRAVRLRLQLSPQHGEPEARVHAGPEPGPADPLLLPRRPLQVLRSEEHTSELQSLMRISYAVFCLQKKTNNQR